MASHAGPDAASPLPAEPLLRPLLVDALTWLGVALAALALLVWLLALIGKVEERRVPHVAGFAAILFGAMLTMSAGTLVLVGADALDEAVWLFLGVGLIGLGAALRKRARPAAPDTPL